jgi:hypothetical protein
MRYSCFHEATNFRSGTVGKGARSARSRAALQGRLRDASLPDPSGERPRTVSPQDSRKPRMCLANGEECHPSLQRARPRRPRRRLLAPQARPRRFRCKERRGFKGDAPPLCEGVRAQLEPVDSCDGLRGRLRGGAHRDERVSGETIRATLSRLLSVRWMRAKRWITSPDPLYERKKGGATG